MEKSFKNIEKEILLVGEGKDEWVFFNALLKHLNIGNIQIAVTQGKTRYDDSINLITKMPGFNNLKALLLTRDADDSATGAFDSLKASLRKYSLPVPDTLASFKTEGNKSSGVFVFPDNTSAGMLENLFVKAMESHSIYPCVDAYMNCLEARSNMRGGYTGEQLESELVYPNNPIKARAKTILAGLEYDIDKIGLAAQRKVWNLDHPSLIPFRAFITTASQLSN